VTRGVRPGIFNRFLARLSGGWVPRVGDLVEVAEAGRALEGRLEVVARYLAAGAPHAPTCARLRNGDRRCGCGLDHLREVFGLPDLRVGRMPRPGEKICPGCKGAFPIGEIPPRKGRCKECARAYLRMWRTAHRNKTDRTPKILHEAAIEVPEGCDEQDFLTVVKNANEMFLVARDEAAARKKKAAL